MSDDTHDLGGDCLSCGFVFLVVYGGQALLLALAFHTVLTQARWS